MAPTEDAYAAVLEELGKLHQAWQVHREVINRAVNLLNQEVINFTHRLDADDQARVERQQAIDAQFAVLLGALRSIRRWQWIRIGVELLAIGLVLAFVLGRIL